MRNFFVSLRFATNGLLRALADHRNLKVHWVSGLMVMFVGMALELNLTARAALLFSVFLVIFAEILNSALEAFVDLHIKDFHQHAMIAKDAAAAGVLVLAVAVLVVFVEILVENWAIVEGSWPDVRRTLIFGLPITALTATVLVVRLGRLLWAISFAAAMAMLVPLAISARAHVFTVLAVLFTLLAWISRRRHPVGTEPDRSRPDATTA